MPGDRWSRALGLPPQRLAEQLPGGLEVARDRAVSRGLIGSASLVVADAERLPLPDRSVDRVSIAFGLRNCTDKPAVLAEAVAPPGTAATAAGPHSGGATGQQIKRPPAPTYRTRSA